MSKIHAWAGKIAHVGGVMLFVAASFVIVKAAHEPQSKVASARETGGHWSCQGCFDPYYWCKQTCGGVNHVKEYQTGRAHEISICTDGATVPTEYQYLCSDKGGVKASFPGGEEVGACFCDDGRETRKLISGDADRCGPTGTGAWCD